MLVNNGEELFVCHAELEIMCSLYISHHLGICYGCQYPDDSNDNHQFYESEAAMEVREEFHDVKIYGVRVGPGQR